MTFATISDLRESLSGRSQKVSPEYRAKMLHPIPEAKEVDRAAFVLQHCRGKRVLEFGASGKLHDAIADVAAAVYASDKAGGVDEALDLDDVTVPYVTERRDLHPDLIICGEILEHLGNPLWFLTRLRRQYAGIPLIVTVPNAMSFAHPGSWLGRQMENVNVDHVAWYSPHTISVLLQRAGYPVGGLFWYGGAGPTAEGLVVVTE